MQMHLPIIRRAKERGIYVITCDFISENEGHKIADEAYFDSTTDISAVYKLAKKCEVDGIMTFNSDPAALTASYVAEQLGLASSGFKAVKIMSEKDEFRKFLSENEFNVPRFGQYTDVSTLLNDLNRYKFPIIIKPVDSSGSKGVSRIDNVSEVIKCFEKAMSFSRCKRIIVEEFILPYGAQLHGDAFVKDGKIEFIYLGDHHFDSNINNLVPISTTFPSSHSVNEINAVEQEVQRFVTAVGFRQGGINIEARINANDGKVYLIEIGARNGGNFTPIVIQYASGFNFMDASLDAALGLPFSKQKIKKEGNFAYLILHSKTEGKLKQIELNPILEKKVIKRIDYVKKDCEVKSFQGANAALGVLIVKFNSEEDMKTIVDGMGNYCQIILY